VEVIVGSQAEERSLALAEARVGGNAEDRAGEVLLEADALAVT